MGDLDLRSERSEFDDDATSHTYTGMGLGPRYTAPLLDYSMYAQGHGLGPGLGQGGYHMRRVGSAGSLGHVHPFHQRISPRSSQLPPQSQPSSTAGGGVGSQSQTNHKHKPPSPSHKSSGNSTKGSPGNGSQLPSPPYTDSDETHAQESELAGRGGSGGEGGGGVGRDQNIRQSFDSCAGTHDR